jgi:two-component system sensor histidine kinase KdpD
MDDTGDRPDPDALLARVQAQERRAARGKLRIYFGASAGVGKTYAMLAAARKLQSDGHSLLVGVIETHGRKETAALLDGLDVLPLKTIAYHGKEIDEFDLDAALARHPPLILVDELAHSNVPGSRHPKRWQDVEELLDAGIDVFCTVNVQHLESLNDVIGGITGIRVGETVPDTVFDAAEEVVLVDIPADELLARLKAGKVYLGPQVERATRNFFRKGNLIALRELALRRTAERIEDDVRAYRVEQSIAEIWKTGAALLACVGPGSGGEHVVRSTARLASQLGTDWHAIYVETPVLQRLRQPQREAILTALKLAQELGASTAVLSGQDVAQEIVAYARSHNLSKITLGRRRPHWPWRRPSIERIASCAPDTDLIELGAPSTVAARAPAQQPAFERPVDIWPYCRAACVSIGTALALALLQFSGGNLALADSALLVLLTVVLVALRLGRGPALLATCLGAAQLVFSSPPGFTFAIADFKHLVTVCIMLAVGSIAAHLIAGLRFQAHVAAQRAGRAQALYEFARELSGALQAEQIFATTRRCIAQAFRAQAVLLVPDQDGHLTLPASAAPAPAALDLGIAQWAFDHAASAGLGTTTLPASALFYLPLVTPMRTRGVLVIEPSTGSAARRWILIPEQRQQLDTFAALAAIALERVHYITVAQEALVSMESERLRNSLLAALSRDLRTPLAALVGLSDTLLASTPTLAPPQLAQAGALRDEAERMRLLVNTLLLELDPTQSRRE